MQQTITIDELLDFAVQLGVKRFREPTHPPAENFARFLRQDILDADKFSKNRMRQAIIKDVEETLASLSGTAARTHVNLSALADAVKNDIRSEGSELGAKLGLGPEEIIPSVLKADFIAAANKAGQQQGLDIEDDLSALESKLPSRIVGAKDFDAAIVAAFGSDYYGDLDELNADVIAALGEPS